jgi:hypothetical protein
MEWSMLLVAAVLAAAAVTAAHIMRRHPIAEARLTGPERRMTEERAVRAVEADAEAARDAAEELSLQQRIRG